MRTLRRGTIPSSCVCTIDVRSSSRKHIFSTKVTNAFITRPIAALILPIIISKGKSRYLSCYKYNRTFRVDIVHPRSPILALFSIFPKVQLPCLIGCGTVEQWNRLPYHSQVLSEKVILVVKTRLSLRNDRPNDLRLPDLRRGSDLRPFELTHQQKKIPNISTHF